MKANLANQEHPGFVHTTYFTSLEDARERVETWRVEYNEVRPHGALGYLAPKEFAASKVKHKSAPSDQKALI